MKTQDMLSTGVGAAACVEGRGVGGQHRIELLEEEKGQLRLYLPITAS